MITIHGGSNFGQVDVNGYAPFAGLSKEEILSIVAHALELPHVSQHCPLCGEGGK